MTTYWLQRNNNDFRLSGDAMETIEVMEVMEAMEANWHSKKNVSELKYQYH